MKGLRQRYEGMSDQDLQDIVQLRSGEYTMEAREVACTVLSERGVTVALDPDGPPPPRDQVSAGRRQSPLLTSAVLAAIWVPVIYGSIDAAGEGDMGSIIFFLIAAILLTPLGLWLAGAPLGGGTGGRRPGGDDD